MTDETINNVSSQEFSDEKSRDIVLETLQKKIDELTAQNDSYIKTIHMLSSELIESRKRTVSSAFNPPVLSGGMPCLYQPTKQLREPTSSDDQDFPAAKRTRVTTPRALSPINPAEYIPFRKSFEGTSSATEGSSLNFASSADKIPIEIFSLVFVYLRREDLDQCQLVCNPWNSLIKSRSKKLQPRVIQSLKLIEKGYISLSASTKDVTKKYSFSLESFERTDDVFAAMKRLLRNCAVKRWIICNLTFTDDFFRRLSTVFKDISQGNQNAQDLNANSTPFLEVFRLEMLAVNLSLVSPDVFHRFLGRMVMAQQYFVDGARNATEEHFNHTLLEQPAIRRTDDLTIYDVRAIDSDEVVLDMGDDALIEFIFGNKDLSTRNTLYLDSPHVSSNFLKTCLLHFVDADDIDRIITHVEFAHCHEQHVPTLRCITLEYEHDIQIEWSAKNRKTGRVMEARVSRNGDGDNFCHMTLNLQSL
ncbi:hypothetical protein DdX_11327 [Ditylenchus destructor]|uniref:F-box domain-containing protein n=1 Tax=Ditylenchus destructor TaxID=166010 RepID=A0AAD4N2J6_9BILA|nr:hypothetical protein DdX_11327 [Ditylenchus destructor]